MFIVLSYAISVIGFINIGQIHSTAYDVNINMYERDKNLWGTVLIHFVVGFMPRALGLK